MARISQLFVADTLDGTEVVPILQAGRTKRTPMKLLAAAVAALMPAEFRGAPGRDGIVASVGLSVLFTSCAGLPVADGVTAIRTAGYREAHDGGHALYEKHRVPMAAPPAAMQGKWWFKSAANDTFLLSNNQRLHAKMFGAWGNATVDKVGTDDIPAWDAMHAFLKYHATGPTDWKKTPLIDWSGYDYEFSRYIDLNLGGAYHFYSSGSGNTQGGSSTFFFSQPDGANGVNGIVCQSWNTAGINDFPGRAANNGNTGASGSVFVGIHLRSRGGMIGRGDGWRIKCNVKMILCSASHFGRDGKHAVAYTESTEGRFGGNANQGMMIDCHFAFNGHNGATRGHLDANGWTIINCDFVANGRWGDNDDSQLGNTLLGGHFDGNGRVSAGPHWKTATLPRTAVSYLNKRYRAVPRLDVTVSRDDPALSETIPGTNNNIWFYVGEGGADDHYTPWVQGAPYAAGGSFGGVQPNNKTAYLGPYVEKNQNNGWIPPRAMHVSAFSEVDFGASQTGNEGRISSNAMRLGQTALTPATHVTINGAGVDFSNPLMNAELGQALRIIAQGPNVVFKRGNADGSEALHYTGPNHPGREGADSIIVPRLYAGTTPRRFGAIFTLGELNGLNLVRGDFFTNAQASVGGIAAWIVTADGIGGQTAVVEPVGIIGSRRAAAVPVAAGATPTKAEFDALVAALKTAGLMAA